MPWIPLAVAGAQVAGGLIGAEQAGGERQASMEQIQKAVQDLEAVGIPSVEAQKLVLEQYRNEGQLTPEMEQSITQQGNGYDDIKLSPQYKDASLQALNSLRGISDSGGMNLGDRANLEQVLSSVGQADKGRRDAAKSRLGARGQLGSGMELLADLQSAQDANQTASQTGLQTAGMAQQRALEAIKQGGALGAQMNQQEFSQGAQAANARNAIAQFNAQAQQNVANRNVNRANDAQAANLQNKQNISNSNVDTRNKQQSFNKGLIQQDFENQMKKGTATANANMGAASSHQQAGDRTAGQWAGIGSALGQAGSAIYKRQNTMDDDEKYGRGQTAIGNWNNFGGLA
jgi:hypothetical protein